MNRTDSDCAVLLILVMITWAIAYCAKVLILPLVALALTLAGWQPAEPALCATSVVVASMPAAAATAAAPQAWSEAELATLPAAELRQLAGTKRRISRAALITMILAKA